MECFWLSWVLVLWPIPGLRRFDRDASAPWPSPTCRSRECWTSGQARRWPCGPETRRNAPGWPSRRPRRPLSEAGGLAQGPRNRLDRFEPLAEPRDAGKVRFHIAVRQLAEIEFCFAAEARPPHMCATISLP